MVTVEPQLFTEIKSQKLYIRVVNQIRSLMVSGKLKAGDKLPSEMVLARRLGVSRPSIREGIVALEILGLVESRGGKGNFIRDSIDSAAVDNAYGELESKESPFELLEARKIVEVEVAGCAAENATDEDIAKIKQTSALMRESVGVFMVTGDYTQPSELDRRFHVDIVEATHNTVLRRIVLQIFEGLKEDLWMRLKSQSWSTPGRPQRYLSEHEDILAAIEKKDAEMARETMRKHLSDIQADLFGQT